MALQLIRLTADDLARFPDDGKRYEIIEGELHVSPSPDRRHQTAVRALFRLLDGHVLKTGQGQIFVAPVDVKLSDVEVVQPDVLFIRKERMSIYPDSAVLGAPDLVVEVLSPSTRAFDESAKLALYARSGVREYWLVDPAERTLRVLVLQGAGYAVQDRPVSRVFPDLTIDPGKLFADLD